MRLTDPTPIRALAHPLRLDLLELLMATGPATAAQCGRALGVPQANCSFHLRQLAKYGFVEQAEPGRDQRERRWQVPSGATRVRVPAETDPTVRRELQKVVVHRQTQAILAYVEGDGRPVQRIAGGVAALTEQEAAEVWTAWNALIEPYIAAGRRLEPGRHYHRYFLATTPTMTFHQGETQNAG